MTRRPGLLALTVLTLSACSTGGSPAGGPVSGPAPEGTSSPSGGLSTAETAAAPSVSLSPTGAPTTEPATATLRVVVDLGDGTAVSGGAGRLRHGTVAAGAAAAGAVVQRLRGQEKIAALPAPLSLDGESARSDAPALTIGYYNPSQSLVVYYEDVGTFGGIVPLGRLDDVGPVVARTEDFTATLRAGG